ncbi:FAD-dependent oxidoreductase [Microbacterium luticocti]|uniref:FAD-dependent oxidoreductase n=1 Tax=Microbacterium luticocti TaxID=451764 RepID=UPI000429EB83|nr:FAD-dependent oxidoreductase [Microbacterium luticocti]
MRTVAVLGAGPAGLAAAHAALAAGAHVVVLDEGERIGGQFWRHHDRLTRPGLQHQWARFTRLRDTLDTAAAAGAASVLTSTSVWHVEVSDGVRLHTLTGPADAAGRPGRTIVADALVLATGAHDRALPVPGWTLPGVTTAGAAQALAKRDGVTLGRRTVVAGTGPFLLPVAASLLRCGSAVPAVIEAAAPTAIATAWGRAPWRFAALPGKAAELAEYAGLMARHRTGYRTSRAVTRIHGTAAVEAVTVQRVDRDWHPIAGTDEIIECDAVALGHGFTPRLEAAVQSGCALTAAGFVGVDDAQATSVPGVYAAGEIIGIAGADAALAEGVIAGFAAAGGDAASDRVRGARRLRRRMRDFARRLDAHAIGAGWTDWVEPDTIVCRCESVRRAVLDEYADASTRGLRLATRAGLGACQGRTCGRSVEDLLGRPIGFQQRPVLASLRIGELADLHAPVHPTHPTEQTEQEQR